MEHVKSILDIAPSLLFCIDVARATIL